MKWLLPFSSSLIIFLWYFLDHILNLGSTYIAPVINAIINLASGTYASLALYHIKKHDYEKHAQFMVSTIFLATAFFTNYVLHHIIHPPVLFCYDNFLKFIYYPILAIHVIGAAISLPFILATYYFAITGKFNKHRKVGKYVLPTWIFVMYSGVVVFLFLLPCMEF